MVDNICKFSTTPFTNSQKILIKLLCEYYEQKLENKDKEIEKLNEQNVKLSIINKELKDHVSLLQKIKTNMATELREAKNTIRILSKVKESEEECRALKFLNISAVSDLVQNKVNEISRQGKEMIMHENEKKMSANNKKNNINKVKIDLKSHNSTMTETKKIKRTLKKIVEVHQETQSISYSKNQIKKESSILFVQKSESRNILEKVQKGNKENKYGVFLSKNIMNEQLCEWKKKEKDALTKLKTGEKMQKEYKKSNNIKLKSKKDLLNETYLIL